MRGSSGSVISTTKEAGAAAANSAVIARLDRAIQYAEADVTISMGRGELDARLRRRHGGGCGCVGWAKARRGDQPRRDVPTIGISRARWARRAEGRAARKHRSGAPLPTLPNGASTVTVVIPANAGIHNPGEWFGAGWSLIPPASRPPRSMGPGSAPRRAARVAACPGRQQRGGGFTVQTADGI